jgi:hypothetical protein
MTTEISRIAQFLRLFLLGLLLLGTKPALAAETFLKGGVIFHPRDLGFEGRWRAALGSDYPVNFAETIYAGFEMQTSIYRQDVTPTGPTATVAPLNGFFNVKYKSGSLGARPFGGGGLGLVSTIRVVQSDTDWINDFGYHLLGGVELGRLVLEVQLLGAFESEADTEFAGYIGFVW